MNDRRKGNNRLIYLLLFIIFIIVIFKSFDNLNLFSGGIEKLTGVLTPFISGLIIAYLFYIPCRGIENLFKKAKPFKKVARILSILIVYAIAILLIVLLIKIVIPAISKSIVDLASNLPGYYNSAMQYVEEMPENSFVSKEDVTNVISNLQQINIAEVFSFDNIVNYIKGVFGVANVIFNIVVSVIVSIYILLDRTRIISYIRRLNNALYNEETSKRVNNYIIKANNVFLKFVSSQILDGIIVGIIVSIVLLIMKVKYAVLLGFLIGLFNLIPFYGSIVAIAIATIITLFTGGFIKAIWMLFVVIIIQQIDANIINPRIVGKALKIRPIIVIFAVTVFGAYFGVIGMFLAVPIVAVIKIITDDYIESKNKKEEVVETEKEKTEIEEDTKNKDKKDNRDKVTIDNKKEK